MKGLGNAVLGLVLFVATCLKCHCHVSENDTKLVRIHFANKTTDEIPLFAFQELFSLPPNYLCSSTQVIDATNSHVVMKSFFVGCYNNQFHTFLFTFHFFITKFSFEVLRESNYQEIFDKNKDVFSCLKQTEDDFKIAFPILREYSKNERLTIWLTEYIKGRKINYFYSCDILQKWNSDFQFAYPVVFLQNLTYESDKKHIKLSLKDLESENNLSKIGAGGFSTCYRVNFKCPYQEQSDFQNLVLKRFKKTYQSENTIRLSLREFSILQRGGVVSREKYNVPYAVVVESSKSCIPIGYLMPMAEHGDLAQFLKNRPNVIVTEYFIVQLFELAEAINNLHKHDILHLDITVPNIFVRKITPKGNNDENDYELILGDFGSSEMKEWNQKCYFNYERNKDRFPPEYFYYFYYGVPCDSYSDFYMFGRMLNYFTKILSDPTIKTRIGYFFSYLINGTYIFHSEQRLGFAEVEKYFNYILENHDPNMCVMRYPYDKDGNVPTWLYKPENPDPNSDYSIFVEKYKACNFEYVHFIIDTTNPNQALPKQVYGKTTHVGQIVIYEFQCDYPYAISLPQTNHQKKYFFKGSLLLFESDVFCYAEFYNCEDEDKVGSTIATYDYLEIVGMINFEGIEYIRRVKQQ